MKRLALTGGILAAIMGPAAAMAGELPAQESLQGLQFNLSPPGARSLGMGGAFIGRADDATAAYANPAGLTNLVDMEFSVEGRRYEFDTTYTSGGTFPDDLTRSTSNSSLNNLSFASFALPFGESGRLTAAAYYHQYLDFENAFSAGEILVPLSIDGISDALAIRPTDNVVDLDIANYGAALGWRLADNFSIGAGVSYFDFSMLASTTRRFSENDIGPPGEPTNVQTSTGSDNDVGFNVGALWNVTDTVSLGLVYRSAPEFDATHMFTDLTGTFDNWMTQFTFEAPEVYGVGLSWQPTDQFTLGLDVNRVNYSNLASTMFSPVSENPGPEEQAVLANIGIDDGTEVRLGVEYVFLFDNPLAVRAGIWNDPAHDLESNNPLTSEDFVFDTTDPNFESDLFRVLESTLYESFYGGGDDEIHYTFGLGMTFDSFQIDAAADFSDIQNVYSVSAVVLFR